MIYHVYNKSIADFVIFNNDCEFSRMLLTIRYYQPHKQAVNLSRYIEREECRKAKNILANPVPSAKEKLVYIIAYCLMPTHLHLILQETQNKGIQIFISTILNSYTRYFNIKHNRKGPLWEGKYKKVPVETDGQLLHLTRYVHLNPVTAYIVNKPEEWPYSSYKEYLSGANLNQKICSHDDFINIDPVSYREFVEDRISYQRELAKIRSLTIE